MAGRRHKHFRSGDLNEELGILLLKGIAAVANVARPEDVGIDAIATLLRNGPNDMLIAENSFYVQFKSSSHRKLTFADHEVRWLEQLRLPFFIGSVRKADSAIDLYPTHRLSQVILEAKYSEIHLFLDEKRHLHEDGGARRINIGPPLLSWSINDLVDRNFSELAFSVLKPYLDAEERNILYREVRYVETISWETGKPPKAESSRGFMRTTNSTEEFVLAMKSMSSLVGTHLLTGLSSWPNFWHESFCVNRRVTPLREGVLANSWAS
jgi:hypothetical protein